MKNDEFTEKIMAWWQSFDAEKYDEVCRSLFDNVLADMSKIEDRLIRF